MFISVHLPLADLRHFLEEDTGKLDLPFWPMPDSGEFLRGYGPVVPRIKGGEHHWSGGANFCSINSKLFLVKPNDAKGHFRLFPVYKRLYFDGKVYCKLELGFRVGHYLGVKPKSTSSIIDSLIESLKRWGVKLNKQELEFSEFIFNRKKFSASLIDATTRVDHKNKNNIENPLLDTGIPLVCFEGIKTSEELSPLGFNYRCHRVNQKSINVLYTPFSSIGASKHMSSINRNYRAVRMNLVRLMMERQIVSRVIRSIKFGALSESSIQLDVLSKYLNEATRTYFRDERKMSERDRKILGFIKSCDFPELRGRNEDILNSLEMVLSDRGEVARKVKEMLDQLRENMMSDEKNEINHFHGDVVLTKVSKNEGKIEASINKGVGSPKSDALLKELKSLVEKLGDSPNDDAQKQIEIVQGAVDSIEEGNMEEAESILKNISMWTFNLAKDIGAKVITEIILG